jgi:hypothetical protein
VRSERGLIELSLEIISGSSTVQRCPASMALSFEIETLPAFATEQLTSLQFVDAETARNPCSPWRRLHAMPPRSVEGDPSSGLNNSIHWCSTGHCDTASVRPVCADRVGTAFPFPLDALTPVCAYAPASVRALVGCPNLCTMDLLRCRSLTRIDLTPRSSSTWSVPSPTDYSARSRPGVAPSFTGQSLAHVRHNARHMEDTSAD